jgi:hypothetical protein
MSSPAAGAWDFVRHNPTEFRIDLKKPKRVGFEGHHQGG